MSETIAKSNMTQILRAEEALISKRTWTRQSKFIESPRAHAYGDPAADVNRFAHLFTADYVDPVTGKKSLVITETQSDWAREGRSKGYKEEHQKDWKMNKVISERNNAVRNLRQM